MPRSYIPREECFFQLPGQNLSNGVDVKLVFQDNFADNAGSVLYGGKIDHCKLTGLDTDKSGEVFGMLVHIEDNDTDYKTTSKISSDPFCICPCKNNLLDCGEFPHYNVPELVYQVYPGETFQVCVVTDKEKEQFLAQ